METLIDTLNTTRSFCPKADVEGDQKLAEVLASKHLEGYNLTGHVRKTDHELKSGGGFYDIYWGELHEPGTTQMKAVVIRVLRSMLTQFREDPDAIGKTIAKELRIWAPLKQCDNILPLLGYSLDWGHYPVFISERMLHGTVQEYYKANPQVSIWGLVTGIANGLSFLHTNHVIHSDMKSENVLVSGDGTPKLIDFGISRLLVISRAIKTTAELAGSVRWMAKEYFPRGKESNDDPPLIATKKTDVWAFGMTVYELLTGNYPYAEYKRDGSVVGQIMAGLLPQAPIDLNKERAALWNLCNNCWHPIPSSRPTMSEILEDLKIVSTSAGDIFLAEARTLSIRLVIPDDVLIYTTLEGHVTKEKSPMSAGSFSDLYKGRWYQGSNPSPCLIVIREIRRTRFHNRLTRLVEAAKKWAQFNHLHVSPVLGTTSIQGNGWASIITPFYANGDIESYLSQNGNHIPHPLDKVQQLASGLAFLHQNDIVHGDLRPSKILVADDGSLVVSAFELQRLLGDENHQSITIGVGIHYKAPELIKGSPPTTHSDAWSFAMIVYRILSGQVPYGKANWVTVMSNIILGELPSPQEENIVSGVWDTLCGCWEKEPQSRISMVEVIDSLVGESS